MTVSLSITNLPGNARSVVISQYDVSSTPEEVIGLDQKLAPGESTTVTVWQTNKIVILEDDNVA